MSIFTDNIGYTILDLGFEKSLTKALLALQQPSTSAPPEMANVFTSGTSPKNIIAGELISSLEQSSGVIFSGKTSFSDTTNGYRMGIDASDLLFRLTIGTTGQQLDWNVTTANTLTISGALAAGSIDIGGADATSFHVDTDANMWLGAATFAAGPFRVTNTGAATATSITITGGSISSTPISSIPNNTSTDISLLEFTHNLVFSVTDADTIAWTAGTINLSNGRTFAIVAGNTGNMLALTYIFLDTAVSSTILQTTTTFSAAIGANRSLIGTAQNQTVTASFVPQSGGGLPLVDGAQIGALSIVAGNIAASTITAGKMSVSQLSAITADLGAITAGSIVVPSGGFIRSGQTAFDTGTGWYIANDAGTPRFSIGVGGSTPSLTWNGTSLTVRADILAGGLLGVGTGGDGALSIAAGTTNIDALSAQIVVRNHTSISITGTGALGLINPGTNGTILILKSQGNVTLTSTAAALIDVSSDGPAGGTGGAIGANGSVGSDASSTITLPTGGSGGINNGAGGAAGSRVLVLKSSFNTIRAQCGSAGGGGAGSGSQIGGDGGRGGGCVIIICGGALNFTGTILANGAVGANGVNDAANSGSGGGGGGAAGSVTIIYNVLTANTGTITTNGGNGGNGGSGSNTAGSGGGGGGGGSNRVLGGAGGAETTAGSAGTADEDTAGTGGADGGIENDAGGGGGGGASGYSLVASFNTV
jgi:hypothetical protein